MVRAYVGTDNGRIGVHIPSPEVSVALQRRLSRYDGGAFIECASHAEALRLVRKIADFEAKLVYPDLRKEVVAINAVWPEG